MKYNIWCSLQHKKSLKCPQFFDFYIPSSLVTITEIWLALRYVSFWFKPSGNGLDTPK